MPVLQHPNWESNEVWDCAFSAIQSRPMSTCALHLMSFWSFSKANCTRQCLPHLKLDPPGTKEGALALSVVLPGWRWKPGTGGGGEPLL